MRGGEGGREGERERRKEGWSNLPSCRLRKLQQCSIGAAPYLLKYFYHTLPIRLRDIGV